MGLSKVQCHLFFAKVSALAQDDACCHYQCCRAAAVE